MRTKSGILFHAQNGTGLGHIRRVSLLCSELLSQRSSLQVSVITNAQHTPFLNNLPVKVIKLPKDSISEESYPDSMKKNNNFFISILQNQKPRVLIFDTIFDPDLALYAQSIGIKTVIVQRMIQPSILLERIAGGFYNFFDLIIFPHPQESIGRAWKKIKDSSIGEKVFADGFVTDTNQRLLKSSPVDFELVASLGGGGPYFINIDGVRYLRDHSALTEQIMETISSLSPKSNHGKFCFSLGLNNRNRFNSNNIQNQTFGHVQITSWINDFPAVIKHCQLCISRCGYNTVCEIINARCPCILIPRKCRTESQRAHATWLEEQGAAIVVDEDDPDLCNKLKKIWYDDEMLYNMRTAISKISIQSGTAIIVHRFLSLYDEGRKYKCE